MIVRAINPATNDWTFGAGLNNYASGKAAVAQDCQTRLQSFLGNCFFDLGAGIDWLNFLAGSKSQLALNLAISAVLINTEGVQTVTQLSTNLNPATRNFTVTYTVLTVYGVVNGVAIPPTFFLTTEDGDPLTTETGENIIT